MSSSKRPCERQLPRRRAPKAGTLYLYSQLQELDTAESPFIVEADDSNITKWSVAMSSGALKEHLDLGRLALELEQWSKLAKKPPVILMEIVFPSNYPEGVPFVRMMLREGGARIQMRPDQHCVTPLADYHPTEAKEAFERVARDHGWATTRKP